MHMPGRMLHALGMGSGHDGDKMAGIAARPGVTDCPILTETLTSLAEGIARQLSYQPQTPDSRRETATRPQMTHATGSAPPNNHRLQVLGDARMSYGKSSQRHPLCKTYKIPLSTSRSSAGGRPRQAGLGTKRLIRSQWASVTSERYDLPGLPPTVARPEFRQPLPCSSHEHRTFLGIV